MNFGIICDLSPNTGLGHLTRMRALSDELFKINISCTFFFHDNFKEFILKQTKNLNVVFLTNKKKIFLGLKEKYLLSGIILDSYFYNSNLEQQLKQDGLFVVAIDDHLKKHNANIIFSNRSDININSIKQNFFDNWYFGPEYCLVKKLKRKKIYEDNHLYNVLLHAGGSSAFGKIKLLIESTLKASKKYNLTITLICSNSESKKLIMDISSNLECRDNINIIPFKKNLRNNLYKYDLVVGPAGTTTFETVLAGTLPFSVPLENDGRDSVETWPKIGHLAHLTYEESQSEEVLEKTWSFLIKNYKNLLNNLYINSQLIDGLGPKRVAERILFNIIQNTKKLPIKPKSNRGIETYSKECNSEDSRKFFISRNKDFVRLMSSNPNHIIIWPEHLSWWLNNNIKKFKLVINQKLVAFHWCKSIKDSKGDFIVTGWFPLEKNKDNLKISFSVLIEQVETVRKLYKNSIWIIIMRKENKFVYNLNKRVGFTEACDLSIRRAVKYFSANEKNFEVMEMKL